MFYIFELAPNGTNRLIAMTESRSTALHVITHSSTYLYFMEVTNV